jgi:SAM-dependent methyltransferase
MDLGFTGEVADLYHKYRRGYPPAAIDAIVKAFQLTEDDLAIDLACGTGQIAVPLAAEVRAVIGVDPSPDMLARAQKESSHIKNAVWLLAADTDIPHLTSVLGERSVKVITVGQALHWMDHESLFKAARPLIQDKGGIAILTNGTPLWLQNTTWSQALRAVMEEWLDTKLSYACGTDELSQRKYVKALTSAGYAVNRAKVEYDDDLRLDEIIGGVLSAVSCRPAGYRAPVSARSWSTGSGKPSPRTRRSASTSAWP